MSSLFNALILMSFLVITIHFQSEINTIKLLNNGTAVEGETKRTSDDRGYDLYSNRFISADNAVSIRNSGVVSTVSSDLYKAKEQVPLSDTDNTSSTGILIAIDDLNAYSDSSEVRSMGAVASVDNLNIYDDFASSPRNIGPVIDADVYFSDL